MPGVQDQAWSCECEHKFLQQSVAEGLRISRSMAMIGTCKILGRTLKDTESESDWAVFSALIGSPRLMARRQG